METNARQADRVRKTAAVAVLLSVIGTTAGRADAGTQQPVTPAAESAAFRGVAAAIPLGARVKVETIDGRRYTATLLEVTSDAIVIKREGRLPEPAVAIAYDRLARLQRHDKNGTSTAKVVGVGLAAGAGAMLAFIAFLFAVAE